MKTINSSSTLPFPNHHCKLEIFSRDASRLLSLSAFDRKKLQACLHQYNGPNQRELQVHGLVNQVASKISCVTNFLSDMERLSIVFRTLLK